VQLNGPTSAALEPKGKTWQFLLLFASAGALNYVFNVVMAHVLDPVDFGALSALLALTSILLVPSAGIQTVTARYMALEMASLGHKNGRTALVVMTVLAGALGVCLALILGGESGRILMLLHLNSQTAVFVAGSVLFLGLLVPVASGALQGLQQLLLLGLHLLSGALVRVIGALILTTLGLQLIGGLVAIVLGSLVAFAVGMFSAVRALRSKGGSPQAHAQTQAQTGEFASYAMMVFLAVLPLTIVANMDVIAVRHYLPSVAGEYAAVAVIAKIPLIFCGALGVALFPRIVVAHAAHETTRQLLHRSFLVAVAFMVSGAIAIHAPPSPLPRLLVGESYHLPASLSARYYLAMLMLGLVGLCLQYCLATNRRWILVLLWVDALALGCVFYFRHSSMADILNALLMNGFVLLLTARSYCRESMETAALDRSHLASRSRLLGLTVVMPAYNEASRICDNVAETVRSLRRLHRACQLIVVDDGSCDKTFEQALLAAQLVGPFSESASPGARRTLEINVIRLPYNCGKGMAVRYGLVKARHEIIAFLDSDLDVNPEQLGRLIYQLDRTAADIIIGSKFHPASRLEWPWFRRVWSWTYAQFVSALFDLPVHDTQTGIKVFRREALERAFSRALTRRYALDLELLVNARRLGYRIAEASVDIEFRRERGRISAIDAWHLALDTLAIAYRLYVLRYYQRLDCAAFSRASASSNGPDCAGGQNIAPVASLACASVGAGGVRV